MSSPTTSMEAFGAAVVKAVRAYFSNSLNQSGLFDPQDPLTDDQVAALKTPAIFIAIESHSVAMDEDGMLHDPGNRVPFDLQVSARCWLSDATDDLPLRIAEFAGRMAALVMAERSADSTRRGNRWGLGDAVEWPTRVDANPAPFVLHGRAAWDVSWSQRIYTDGALP